MPLLANVILATSRSQYSAAANNATGGTNAPLPYLSGILAHLDAPTQQQAVMLASEGITAKYTATVDSGTDIVLGDTITSITLLDGMTPYPIAAPSGSAITVAWVTEDAPLLLPARVVYLSFTTTQGPATAYA